MRRHVSKKKPKFYVVWEGKKPGVYTQWAECQASIQGFSNAKYMSFPTLAGAQAAYEDGHAGHWGQKEKKKSKIELTPEQLAAVGMPREDALCVDAACNAQTQVMEYRGVWYEDRAVYFSAGPHSGGTNNIGEFLAIVHGLALMVKEGKTVPIYSDSRTAIAWVTRIQVKSQTRARGETSNVINQLVDRALKWLIENSYPNEILKWRTDVWGEVPADYGRK
jgi:ribonuclease HI